HSAAFRNFLLRVKSRRWTSAVITGSCSAVAVDNHLQLLDLRRRSNECTSFRADGFSCGSDSTKAVISPDGGFLAAGSADGTLYIWNVSTGKMERHLPGKHISAISAVSWSPSGKYVVSVDKGRTAVLWSDV
ncbi:Autophagy-related protein 16 APG16-like 1, partial [Takifugu flavidus]